MKTMDRRSLTTESPLVSIIVPVYRAEAYLTACVDSILSQSIGDLSFC